MIIINGIEMQRINPERKSEKREMDLVVINHSLGLIINIECQKKGQKSRMAKLKEKIVFLLLATIKKSNPQLFLEFFYREWVCD